jgi:hypothetical protein
MLRRIVPGHYWAHTLWWSVVMAAVAYWYTHSLISASGCIVLGLGAFLGDQATHLAQEDHKAKPPTWIERMLQGHRWVSVVLSVIVSVLGLTLILSGSAR